MHFFTDTLQILSATTLIGLLLAMAFFIREERSKFLPEAIRIRNLAIIPAAVWLISSIGVLFAQLADLLSIPISETLDSVVIRSFVTQRLC
jgi:hypothetical protein